MRCERRTRPLAQALRESVRPGAALPLWTTTTSEERRGKHFCFQPHRQSYACSQPARSRIVHSSRLVSRLARRRSRSVCPECRPRAAFGPSKRRNSLTNHLRHPRGGPQERLQGLVFWPGEPKYPLSGSKPPPGRHRGVEAKSYAWLCAGLSVAVELSEILEVLRAAGGALHRTQVLDVANLNLSTSKRHGEG
jgi:hypothetical protein